ncbi:aromatic ring-hydroxylating oxygenase subunit alpha [Nisaea sediminum]|uniref:aromatic ring-hydroxylating oxygenase subunit alpha n=1 Tax=Nisaea sediminum TaxID=2775867 RepID=UPI0018693C45|nr:aromatic ring-hydroxylating dioxygenase subunit alpha [Nisaea sediminum]
MAVGAQVPDPGDVLPVDVGGQPLVLVRDKAGEISGFHNVCSHRGVLLVTEPMKRQAGLRCPYHSWTYGHDGKLLRTPFVGGPDRHECPAIDKSKLGLRPVRTAKWLDFVFVDLSGVAEALEEVMAPLTARWSKYDFSRLSYGFGKSFSLRANWKLAMENYLESYHLPWVHPELNRVSPLDIHGQIDVAPYIFGQVTANYRPGGIGGRQLPAFPDLDETSDRCGEYPVVYPNLMLGVQRDHLFGIIVRPDGQGRTVEDLHIYFADETALETDYAEIRDQLLEGWVEVFMEDIDVVERMQKGRASSAFDGGVLTPYHDGPTRRFMALVERSVAPRH